MPSGSCPAGQTQVCCNALTPSCMACLQCCTLDQWCLEFGSTDPQCPHGGGGADGGGATSPPSPPSPSTASSGAYSSTSAAAAPRPDRVLPEAVAPETAFRTSDTNNDGYLSSDEVVIGLTVLNGGRIPNATFVSSLDANGDDRIGWVEFKTAVEANDGGGGGGGGGESGSAGAVVLPACTDNVDDCEGWGKTVRCLLFLSRADACLE